MPQIQLFDSVTGETVKVDTNRRLNINLPEDAASAGFAKIISTDGNSIVVTENGALLTSMDSVAFFEQVDGSTVNTNVWSTSVSGMTMAQASGYITLNSGTAVTANAYAILNSIKNIPLYGTLPVKISINALVPILPEANATVELGIGAVATNAAPTDGAFFRWNTSGQFCGVISSGGAETVSVFSGTYTDADGDTIVVPPVINEAEIYEITIVEDLVQFAIGDVLLGEVQVPAGLAFPTSAGRLPLFARAYNGATPPVTAPQVKIGQVVVAQEGMNQQKDWREILAELGRNSYQHPLTYGQTANHVNSASPSSATLSNTAAGYTTLGGKFQFAAVGGAATDYALFGFQIPAGYQLKVYRCAISTVNTGAAVTVGATILDWAVGVNSSAVSLATSESPPTTWAPRRLPLGVQAFKLLDGIGQVAADLLRTFDPPLVIDSGRFFHVILQIPVGTATASQVIRGDVMIEGVFE